MNKIYKQNKAEILRMIRNGDITAAFLSSSDFIDELILTMKRKGIDICLRKGFVDKRAKNLSVPIDALLFLSTAAKMKVHTAISDIPMAIKDHRTLCELEYSMLADDGKVVNGLMTESTIRYFISKYSSEEIFQNYISIVQNHILPKMNIVSNIFLLDCTQVLVPIENSNYEDSTVKKDKDGKFIRGYKLATLRGITGDTGIIQDVRFGTLTQHDLDLSRDMLFNSPMLKPNDILIMDRGFNDRVVINEMKTRRQVDVFTPIRKNMIAYREAVTIAKTENKWRKHPNKKRHDQKIAFVSDLGGFWESDNPSQDVPLNACVVWDTTKDEYFVFVTTDTSINHVQIIKTYELRTEIEEDYRQIKDMWKLEDFTSTQLNVIAYHIISVLLGYVFFQLYIMMPEGVKYRGQSLPVIEKKYRSETLEFVIFYSGDYFGIFPLDEVLDFYAESSEEIRLKIKSVLKSKVRSIE